MLLYILQCMGQSPTTNCQAPNVSSAEAEKPLVECQLYVQQCSKVLVSASDIKRKSYLYAEEIYSLAKASQT